MWHALQRKGGFHGHEGGSHLETIGVRGRDPPHPMPCRPGEVAGTTVTPGGSGSEGKALVLREKD